MQFTQKPSLEQLIFFFLFLSVATSAIVMVEPAPTDLFFLITITLAILSNTLHFEKSGMFGFFIVVFFLLINLLSFFWVSAQNVAIVYLAITVYMVVIWKGIVGIGGSYGIKTMRVIVKTYYIIGAVTALAALLVYFQLIPTNESLFMFDRVKLFFKDPNVLGPFLVLPALYAIAKSELSGKKIYWIGFFIIASGILVSFSRAAWLNLAVSVVVFLLLPGFKRKRKRMRLILLFLTIGVVSLVIISTNDNLNTQLTERLGIQNYDEERFDSQKNAAMIGLNNPFGKGPGQSEIILEIAPHNIFARLLIENGILGVSLFVLLIIASILQAFIKMSQSEKYAYYYMIIISVLIGHSVNSLFIDTLHWRHFWLVIALAWIPEKVRRI